MRNKAYDIREPSLAAAGEARIQWATQERPVLGLIGHRFAQERPLAEMRPKEAAWQLG